MRLGRTDKILVLGGAVGILVMVAIGWFFVIGPQNSETGNLDGQTATARERAATLRNTIAALQRQNPDLARYEARLRADRAALPTSAGMSDFLRELQRAGDSAGLTGGGLAVGSPSRTTAGNAAVYVFPITLTASGTSAELDRFLQQLQQAQPRAVLISSVGVAPHDQSRASTSGGDLTLGMQVFVAPETTSGTSGTPGTPSGAASPAPSATPAG